MLLSLTELVFGFLKAAPVSHPCFQSEQESLLEEREQRCLLEAERLRGEREQLEAQLLEYQQNMDRLREGQRSVEMEKERVEAQQRVLQSWRHNRQSSLPVTIPLDEYKVRREGEKTSNGDAAPMLC